MELLFLFGSQLKQSNCGTNALENWGTVSVTEYLMILWNYWHYDCFLKSN